MRAIRITVILAVTVILAGATGGRARAENETDQLRRQLEELQRKFERVHAEQQREIEALKQQLEALSGPQPPGQVGPTNAVQPAEPSPGRAERGLGEETLGSATAASSSAVAPGRARSPADPIRLQQGSAYMDVGLVGTFAVGSSTADDIAGGTQLGGHDPNQRGFTVQGVQASFAGAVDPYFDGNANILFQVDADGKSNVELEEAWLETLSLPGGLQLRAGQIYTEFGRQNPTHPHTWAFICGYAAGVGPLFRPRRLAQSGGPACLADAHAFLLRADVFAAEQPGRDRLEFSQQRPQPRP